MNLIMKKLLLFASFCWLCAAASAAPELISPGGRWSDDRGLHVQAHGGGIIKLEDTYYWFGEDRTETNAPDHRYVACYSSKDLVHWTFRHQVVATTDPDNLGEGWILERPKVYYNATTKKFVMYAHIDDARYKVASVAIFICDTVDGDYKFLKRFRPLDHESRDIGQFIDDDGTAYLIFEDRPNGFHIAKLSADYLTVEKEMCLIPQHMEGGAVFHLNGLYYVIGSHLTGWNPNPNLYATATSLEGPWSEFKDIAPPEVDTYASQSTMTLKVEGSQATNVIFMGDIWNPQAQWNSRYLWMPLQIDGANIKLPPPENWTLDVNTGVASIGQPAEILPPMRLWSGAAPGALGTNDVDIPTLTPYIPAPTNATGAAMVICPGGGYAHLAPHEGNDYALWLNQHGVAAFVLKYRLGLNGYHHPAELEDAQRALRTVRFKAAAWGIDPHRIGIMGSSAGGHLASTLMTHFDAGNADADDPIDRQSCRPDIGILCYAVITFGEFAHKGSRDYLLGTNQPPELVGYLSNETQVTKDTPPCFIWTTFDDKTVPMENSMMFAEALRKAGVPFDFHVYQHGRHGIGLADKPPFLNPHPWAADCLFWLKAQGFVK